MSRPFTPSDVADNVRISCATKDSLGKPCEECEQVAVALELAHRTIAALLVYVHEQDAASIAFNKQRARDPDATPSAEDLTLVRQRWQELRRELLQFVEHSVEVGELLQLEDAQEVH